MSKKIKLTILILLAVGIMFPNVTAQENTICLVYFTGVGCPHCAKADPIVLDELFDEYDNLVVIEYEIYQQRENAPLLQQYNSRYNSGLGIPLVIIDEKIQIIGGTPIIKNIRFTSDKLNSNSCLLLDGSVDFNDLDITTLPSQPKIWVNDRILIKNSDEDSDNKLLKSLLTTDNIEKILEGSSYVFVKSKSVPLSGSSIKFDNAVELGGWIFQWNGEGLEGNEEGGNPMSGKVTGTGDLPTEDLTIAKIISLAAVDAVNPCALAVLTLMLIAIITYNPKNKKNILLAGFAFVTSVFLMYLFYGLIIIKFFQLVQAITSIRLVLYKFLGGAAIVLGILEMKDFFFYKPGSLGTEMPLSIRPKVQKLIKKVTSPKGAFSVGLFVTLFLLPCTIGPYIIAAGILSALDMLKTLPWLLIYNAIFVLPMVVITFIVYGGIATVENVSEWKEKNIRYLHLISGVIIFGLGLAMVLGWV